MVPVTTTACTGEGSTHYNDSATSMPISTRCVGRTLSRKKLDHMMSPLFSRNTSRAVAAPIANPCFFIGISFVVDPVFSLAAARSRASAAIPKASATEKKNDQNNDDDGSHVHAFLVGRLYARLSSPEIYDGHVSDPRPIVCFDGIEAVERSDCQAGPRAALERIGASLLLVISSGRRECPVPGLRSIGQLWWCSCFQCRYSSPSVTR